MKLEMTSNWLGMLQPGLYGTWLGEMFGRVLPEYETEFENAVCTEFVSVMNEIFSEDWFVDRFGNYIVSNAKIKNPQFYNFHNDWIEFELEIEKPELLRELYEKFEVWDIEHFFKFTKENFGSRPGFSSFFPYERNDFEEALYLPEPRRSEIRYRYKFEMAVSMLIMFEFEMSKCPLDSYQRDFEEAVNEYCYQNELYEEEEK